MKGSYQQEGFIETTKFKGEDAPMMIPKYKMATFLNALIGANFELVQLIESDIPTSIKKAEIPYSSRYYSLHNPTSFIIKARKRL